MTLNPGSLYFTAVITDANAPYAESFSFVVTQAVAPGEQIQFWDADTTPAGFTYTVGAGGLSPLDRVTIAEFSTPASTFTILQDPSGGSVSGLTLGSAATWTNNNAETIMAVSGNQVIAAINSRDAWDENFSDIAAYGVSRTAIDSYLAGTPDPSPVLSNIIGTPAGADNYMFTGTDLTGLDDPANWTGNIDPVDHTNPNVNGTTYATQDANISCFALGTLIATPQGEVAVETLCAGDMVLTADGPAVEVRWIGRQTVVKRFAGEKAQLVRIASGALGNHSELFVTGDHGMVLDGYVVNASALVNGGSIDWVPLSETPERFTVYHVETEAHDVVLANGAPAETFVDYATRRTFDNYAEYRALYPEDRSIPEQAGPRVSSARQVPAHIRSRLNGGPSPHRAASLARSCPSI
ncbi:Hint domain-containing protein [Mameliella sp. CS4]|uniref:Hint domain-containing protein n=1 Tax=Mameliella sp. CS4 TaxID=2862329 RepID=UPI001C5E0679|nr:Hint domain-containing protein [Mameliella sp. CS4]MBW4983848.1 Hint domain-containing protein [Mameliella sp. CS4]